MKTKEWVDDRIEKKQNKLKERKKNIHENEWLETASSMFYEINRLCLVLSGVRRIRRHSLWTEAIVYRKTMKLLFVVDWAKGENKIV